MAQVQVGIFELKEDYVAHKPELGKVIPAKLIHKSVTVGITAHEPLPFLSPLPPPLHSLSPSVSLSGSVMSPVFLKINSATRSLGNSVKSLYLFFHPLERKNT